MSNGILDLLGAGGKKHDTGEAQVQRATKVSPGELPGTELATMAEKQEGLLERVLEGRETPDAVEARADLAALHGILTGLSQKTVVVIFAMGKVLSEVKETLNHGEFLPWVEQNCPFERTTAFRYMQVYERYKDEPRKALAELSISEAYVEAGVKKLALPEPDGARIYGDGVPHDDELPTLKEFASIFKKPTLSGVPLKYHRIVPYRDGKLYVVSEATGPVPVCDLYVDMSNPDVSYQSAISKVHQDLQLALEVFYGTVESLEEKGVVPPEYDSSRPAMVRRMRNVTPEKGSEGEKKPRGKAPRKGAKK